MTKVMCFGTFDLIHPGHLNYFQQAKKYGNKLIVVVARDKNVKKKKMIHKEKERLKEVKKQKIVDQAVLGDLKDHYKIIENIKPDVICLGYDHQIKIKELKKKLKKRNLHPKIKRMKGYQVKTQKSTKIKRSLKIL